MGAEIVSRTPDSPLVGAQFPSQKVKTTDSDYDDENDTVSSASASAEITEGVTSSTTDERSYCEYRNSSDDDIDGGIRVNGTASKDNKGTQQQHRLSMMYRIFSPSNGIFLGKNSVTFVLIPAMLVTAYTCFDTVSLMSSINTPGSFSIKAVTASLLALASYVSRRYMTTLEEYPILTKSLTTGIVQFFGDCAAQRYEQQQEKEATPIHSNKVYDPRRGLSLFADGLLISGPLMHYCFEWMEDAWPTTEGGDVVGLSRPMATLCHVFVNDYIIDSIYLALSFVFTGVVEGYSLMEVVRMFRKDYGATVRASWLTSLGLIPVEIMCFGYLSLSFRVLAMNFVDLLWGAIVSFYSHRSRRENPVQGPEEVSAATR